VIIDGKKIAEEIIVGLGDSLRGKRLGIVVGTEDPATLSFVKIKTQAAERLGVEMVQGELADLIKTCDGIIIQLPHPDADALIAALPRDKDVDGIGKNPLVLSPVAAAIEEVLRRESGNLPGKRAVVVGHGRLVGAPAAELLRGLGAEVTVIESEDSFAPLKNADIVVLGAGVPGLVKPGDLKEGVVLIDAGTSEQGGKVAGDADPRCADIASVFTPVPGGIGPIAVAMIFKNLATLNATQN
jgi:methylenetetrahydrofolate dehydrogenase (NADP+) / methenyltetrahydrofolate cyclohydrolase